MVLVLVAAFAIGAVVASWLEAKEDENAEIECGSRRDVEPGGRVVVREDADGRRLCLYLDRGARTVTQIVLDDGMHQGAK